MKRVENTSPGQFGGKRSTGLRNIAAANEQTSLPWTSSTGVKLSMKLMSRTWRLFARCEQIVFRVKTGTKFISCEPHRFCFCFVQNKSAYGICLRLGLLLNRLTVVRCLLAHELFSAEFLAPVLLKRINVMGYHLSHLITRKRIHPQASRSSMSCKYIMLKLWLHMSHISWHNVVRLVKKTLQLNFMILINFKILTSQDH